MELLFEPSGRPSSGDSGPGSLRRSMRKPALELAVAAPATETVIFMMDSVMK